MPTRKLVGIVVAGGGGGGGGGGVFCKECAVVLELKPRFWEEKTQYFDHDLDHLLRTGHDRGHLNHLCEMM